MTSCGSKLGGNENHALLIIRITIISTKRDNDYDYDYDYDIQANRPADNATQSKAKQTKGSEQQCKDSHLYTHILALHSTPLPSPLLLQLQPFSKHYIDQEARSGCTCGLYLSSDCLRKRNPSTPDPL